MKWRKPNDHHVESFEPEGYTVSRALVWGEIYFTAWHGKQSLDCQPGNDFRAMQAVCESHARKAQGIPETDLAACGGMADAR